MSTKQIPSAYLALVAAGTFSYVPLVYAETETLAPVVVTATRTAQSVDDTLAAVTVFTQEDIKRQQAQNLQELLQASAGLQFVNYGGAGKVASLFLRGAEADHALVLIDGVRVNSATAGVPPLGILPLEMIERIEIVRGPRTSLYGSDAIGGVIQIFTKQGMAGERAKPYLTLQAGSHDTKGIVAGVAGGFSRGTYSLHLKREDSAGFNACTGDSLTFAGCATEEPDTDGYTDTSGAFQFGYQLDDNSRLGLHYLRAQNDVESDGAAPFAPNSSELTSEVYSLSLDTQFNERLELNVKAGHNNDFNSNYQNGAFFSRFDHSRTTLSLQANITLDPESLLTAGLERQQEKIDTTEYAAPSRKNTAIFSQFQGNYAHFDANAGLRLDDNEQFGKKVTGNVAFGSDLGPALKWNLAYGSAFKAPAFNELYFPFYGNPELKPEESSTLEFGLRGQPDWGDWSLHLFRTGVDNLIVYDADLFLANNIAKARMDGAELQLGTSVLGWDINSSLTLLDTEDKSIATYGNELARRPGASFRLDLDRQLGKLQLGGSLLAESDRFDDTANKRPIAGYATADLRIAYAFSKHSGLQLKLGNLLDKHYETASYFPQDGRHFMLSLNYSPK